MKLPLPHAALVLFLGAAGTAHAQSPALKMDTHWYVGAGAGHTAARPDTGDYADLRGGATTQVGTDDSLAWKAYGGWRYSRYWAVELAYANLGRYAVNYGLGGSGGNGSNKLSAWSLALVGTWPLNDTLSLYALAGVAAVHSDYSFTGSGPAYPSSDRGDNHTTNLTLGMGATYAFARNFAVRVDYQSYGRVGSETKNFTKPSTTGESHPGLASVGLEARF